MVRRVNLLTSSRLLWTVLCLALCAGFARAQSPESAQQRSAGSTFLVAPSVALPSAPTSAASGDLKGDGKVDLVVTRAGSQSVTVLLGDGKGGFAPGVDYPAGKQPGNLLLADLSGHGRLDVVVTDSATGAVLVLAGNRDGTLGKAISYRGVQNPVGLVAGNFSGNGKTDLAVASAKGVTVLLNDGSGRFSPASPIEITGGVRSLGAADFRGKGRDDLAAAGEDGSLTVLLGDGNGRFTSLPASKIASGALTSVVSGDFKGDGKADLAVTVADSRTLTVLLGRGDGTFEPGAAYTVGNNPARAIVADLNHDGHDDIVTVNRGSNTFSVLLGKGDGTLRESVDFTAGNSPSALVSGKFSSSGHVDLAILNAGDATISLPAGRGDGSFHAAPDYKTGLEHKAVAAGDLNGDGLPDLVVTNYCGDDKACKSGGTATVFLARRDGTYEAGESYTLGNGPVALALADINGNRKLDLVAVNRDDKTLMVLAGDGTGKFGEPRIYTLPASPRALFVGDFNGDGKQDIAIASDCGRSSCSEPGVVDIWLGSGKGKLALGSSYTVGISPASIAAGDLHGTGHLDLVVANACGNLSSCNEHGTATVLAGEGNGRFTESGEVELGRAPSSIAIGNLTGKGLDLVVAERGSDEISVMHGDGKGGFGEPASYKVGSEPSALAMADFDGDGRLDVAVANFKDSTVSVLKGTAKGTLKSPVQYTVGTGPEAVAVIGKGKSGASGLVTANGNTGASPMGADITTLLTVHPDLLPAPTVNVVATLSPDTVDLSETLTATVTGTAPNAPTGANVSFSSSITGAITCGTGSSINADGATGVTTVVCVTSALQAGSDTITANFSGDANYSTNSGNTPLTVNQANTKTVLTPGSATVDQAVTFTATITPNVTPPPSPASNIVSFSAATVTFFDGATQIPGCIGVAITANSTDATAQCSPTVPNLPAGNVTAVYSGEANYNGSTSNAVAVAQANTTVKLVAAPGGPVVDQATTFTATITPNPAVAPLTNLVAFQGAGTVAFFDGATKITGCANVAVTANATNATAQCAPTTANLPAGNVTAVFNGDANYNTGTSTAIAVALDNTTASTPTSTLAPSSVDQAVTFTTVITPVTGTVGEPIGGTAKFLDGGASIGCNAQTVSLVALNYQASCTTSALTAAASPHNITATYLGDAKNYNASAASGALSQGVNKANTNTVVTSTNLSVPLNTSVTFTATVTPATGTATVAISGNVTFFSDGSTISGCSAKTVTAGAANCATSTLPVGAHLITAIYNGDTNYLGSPLSSSITETIGSVATKTVLTASPSPATVDQTVTISATISPTVGSPTVPISGNVSFSADGTAIAACTGQPIASGVATCMISSLAQAASHALTSNYVGDSNYSGSNGNAALKVNAAPTTTTVSSSANPSATGQTVAFTATVVPTSGLAVTLPINGTVSFSLGGAAIAACSSQPVALNVALYTASCSDSALPAGTDNITATFTPSDTNYVTSNSNASPLQQVVGKSFATTSVASSSVGNSSTVNQTVTFTATIIQPTGGIPPIATGPGAGSVQFSDNGNTIAGCAAATLTLNGPKTQATATCPTSALTGGTHTIVATYSGDTNYLTSSSAVTQTVAAAASMTTVQSSANPSTINGSVVFTATVATVVASTPSTRVPFSGTMTFTDQGNPLAGCSVQVNASTGVATCTSSTLPLNANAIVATYAGDLSYATSNGPLTQTVNPATTSLTLSSSTNPVVFGQTVTFTATIFASVGQATLKGTTEFTSDGTDIAGCSAIVANASGIAQCATTILPVGKHTIVATYAHDSDFASSNFSIQETVDQAQTLVTVLSSSSGASLVNQSVTFTASVSVPGSAGGNTFTGTMTFTNNTSAILSCPAAKVSPAGVATCTTNTLTAGSHTINAAYSNDNSFAGNNSSTTQSVGTIASTLALTANPSAIDFANAKNFHDSVTFTATVSPIGTPVPLSGTVAFTVGGNPIGGCATPTFNPATGVATCTTTSLPALQGGDSISATYSNDSNYTQSTNSVTESVADFTLSVPIPPSFPVTQGYTTSTDPFSPQTINLSPTPISGFSGSLSLTCLVTPVIAATGATPPACELVPNTLPVANGALQKSVGIVIDATHASPGVFAVVATGVDASTGLSNSTTPFDITVSNAPSALNIISGATTGNTATVDFVLPAGVGLTGISCPKVTGPTVTGIVAASTVDIGCAFSPSSVPKAGSQQVATVTVAVETGGTVAQTATQTTILTAGLFGIPLLALFGVARRRRSLGAALFHVLAFVALAAAGMQVLGCGGNFKTTTPTPSGGKTPPGSYYLLIEGAGTDHNQYQAVLKVVVTL